MTAPTVGVHAHVLRPPERTGSTYPPHQGADVRPTTWGTADVPATHPRRSAPRPPRVGQRRTLGIPRPIHEMISRWISLLPPPKVKITADR